MTLIERCKTGDRKAQYEVYKQYAKPMFNVCVRITNSIEEAEDVMQEAFLKMFRSLESYKGDATFGAWFKRIVVNESINHIRRRKLSVLSMDEMQHDLPEAGAQDKEDLHLSVDRVREAIQLLPDGYRIVFSLYLLEGYDHSEIAEILQISESASKSQYSRAKKKLRELLAS
ncbi:RNA polymerase sigma factor [Limibacter armeniacum]|uniref:RNA polymerase sigma factor n=1 Tax=Limibacter armeniacum TaxID=466084 RepID=UPI002FE64A64